MALGNSMSIGKARGKGRATLVKRKKQVDLAKDYHAISGSLVTGGAPCALHNGTVTQSYFHDAGSASGFTVGTYFFTKKRAHEDFWLPNGNYKVTHNGAAYKGIGILNGRIQGMDNCK